MGTRKNFSEICKQFGRAPSTVFTSPVIACRFFVQCSSPLAPCLSYDASMCFFQFSDSRLIKYLHEFHRRK